jgi:hypothetical protein
VAWCICVSSWVVYLCVYLPLGVRVCVARVLHCGVRQPSDRPLKSLRKQCDSRVANHTTTQDNTATHSSTQLTANTHATRQVRVLHVDAADARGPSWARYLVQQLYRGEDFVLQVDSHTRFVSGWDDELLSLHTRCVALSSHGKAIVTTYPAGCVTAVCRRAVGPVCVYDGVLARLTARAVAASSGCLVLMLQPLAVGVLY